MTLPERAPLYPHPDDGLPAIRTKPTLREAGANAIRPYEEEVPSPQSCGPIPSPPPGGQTSSAKIHLRSDASEAISP
jgi:hypothetical protein